MRCLRAFFINGRIDRRGRQKGVVADALALSAVYFVAQRLLLVLRADKLAVVLAPRSRHLSPVRSSSK